uniref:Uncharacterized protein n=1 Tax=Octopus bimaculoides TaxID=37653 RepID=A0A0L8GBG4_OCTBM
MEEFGHRLPKICLYGELSEGKRPRGAPLRRYKDQLKSTLKSTNIDPAHWEDISANRPLWRYTIKTGSADFEKVRVARAELKRRERKLRLLLPKPTPSIPCPQCPPYVSCNPWIAEPSAVQTPRKGNWIASSETRDAANTHTIIQQQLFFKIKPIIFHDLLPTISELSDLVKVSFHRL